MKSQNLKVIYRQALVKGMTAKQAGAFFKVNHNSLAGLKRRYGFPSLISEWEFADRKVFESMTINELKSYIAILSKDGKDSGKEWTYSNDELKKRK